MGIIIRSMYSLGFFVVVVPSFATAQVFAKAVGLFNVFVGLMLTMAILTYAFGFVVWVVRLGSWPSYRTEGIKIMEWAVVILFVLVVLLAIVQFFQGHPETAGYLVSVVAMAVIAGAILVFAAKSGGKKEEKDER